MGRPENEAFLNFDQSRFWEITFPGMGHATSCRYLIGAFNLLDQKGLRPPRFVARCLDKVGKYLPDNALVRSWVLSGLRGSKEVWGMK